MWEQVWQRQLDYVYACYGLAFVLLGAVCTAMARERGERLQWRWLLWFGLVHGVNEWLDMLAMSLGDRPSFRLLRLLVMAASFLFLLEFGRASLPGVSRWRPGWWVYLLLGAGALAGSRAGLAGANAATRYALGLTGGVCAAAVLMASARREQPVSRSLSVAAIAMACYAVAAGVVVPHAAFWPASVVNQTSFLGWTCIPVQLVRAVLACVLTVSIWYYRQQRRQLHDPDLALVASGRRVTGTVAALVPVLALGWALVERAGRAAGPDLGTGSQAVSQHRIEPICFTLLLALFVIVLAAMSQRTQESAQLIAIRERRLAEAQRVARVGSWVYVAKTEEMAWSEEMFRLFGRAPGEVVPGLDSYRACFHPTDRLDLDVARERALQEGTGYSLTTRLQGSAGWVRYLVSKAEAVRGPRGEVIQLLGTEQDVTEQRRVEERLRELSLVDELTGLNNRRAFLVLAEQQMRIADRLRQGLVLIFMDMDGLKSINDSFGHQEGDRALADFAGVLKRSCRAADVVARLGGDEFVCLGLGTERMSGEVLAARLQANVEAHNLTTDRPYRLAVSVGVAEYSSAHPTSLEKLLESGDKAMYRQKQCKRA